MRTDKIGDLVLCLPAFAALRSVQGKAVLTALVREEVRDVLYENPHLNAVLDFSRVRHRGIVGWIRLWREIRSVDPQVVVVFQTNFFVASALFFAFIPYRIGPLSKWWSWLLLNMGIRQTRSNVEMHEAEYNLQLLRDLGVDLRQAHFAPKLSARASERERMQKWLEERGFLPNVPVIAVHPGMAGSALNWPERYYIRLARRLLTRYNVVITGAATEEALVERVFQGVVGRWTYDPERPVVTKYVGKEGLAEFIGLLDTCNAIVAPSTGPMHLATALGKKVVTLFSPIMVQSAIRWGPYGVPFGTNLGVSPEDKATVLVPDVNCAEQFRCALSACMYYPCMPRISVEDVETQVQVLLEGAGISMFKSSSALRGDPTDLDEDFEEETIEGQI